MKPTVAVEITSKDKSDSGFKSAERRAQGFARKTAATAREGGFERLGRSVEGLMRFRQLSFGFESAGRSLSTVGGMAHTASAGVEAMTRNILTFGTAAPKALQGAAAAAGTLAGGLAAAGVAIVGLAAGTYMLGDKWARIGAGIGRAAEDFGISAQSLQARRAAGERFGVSAEQTDSAIEGLGSTLYDAKYGANNLALGALNQLGLKLKEKEDGSVDVDAMLDDISDAIARQKNPQVQRKLAAVFGVSSMLPALRQGSGALKAEGQDFMASGGALTDAQIAQAKEAERKAVRLKQQLGTLEKGAGTAAMGVIGPVSDTTVAAWRDAGRSGKEAGAALKKGADDLVRGGREAGNALVEGAKRVWRGPVPSAPAAPAGGGFAAFAARIRHQESRGRQFDRRGRPLTSSAGAIGAMQMLPETAQRAARLGGVTWDPHRFRYDQAYNEQLGQIWLGHLLDEFGGNEVLAAAAYNAGEGRLTGFWQGKGAKRRRVKGWLERFGDPRKGEISDRDFAARIPFDETRTYVANTASLRAPSDARAEAGSGALAASGQPSKAEVTIVLKGAPPGTVVTARADPGVGVPVNVVRGMDF